MACYHFTIKSDKKPDGTRIKAIDHVKYINREGKYKNIDQSYELQNFSGNSLGPLSTEKNESPEKYLVYKSPFGHIRFNGTLLESSVNSSFETVAISLTAAMKKYGEKIVVTGTNDFKAKLVIVAAEMKLPVQFSDPEMEKLKIKLQEEYDNGRDTEPTARRYELHKHYIERIGSKAPPQRRGCLHSLSKCGMVQYAERGNMLLPSNVSSILDNQQTDMHSKMRWHLSDVKRLNVQRTADKILEIKNKNDRLLASSHVDYINRDRIFSWRGGCIYKNHHLPKWANDSPKKFFEAAEQYEGVGYCRYKEIEFALPNEIGLERQKEIVNRFLNNHLQDFYYAYAIHDKIGVMSNGQHNTHVHIMFSERKLDNREKTQERSEKEFFMRPSITKDGKKIGGCLKDKKWNGIDRAKYLCIMRKDFAMIQNEILEKYGFNVRVDHRTLKAQREEALANGDLILADLLNRMPEQHIGPNLAVQKNHSKVKDLQRYRQEKTEYGKLLYAVELLELNLSKSKEMFQIQKSISAIKELSHSTKIKEILNSPSPSLKIRTLKTDMLNSLKEVQALRNTVIWNDTAVLLAQEKFMETNERELFQRMRDLEKRRSSLKIFESHMTKPPNWNQESLKIFTDLKNELYQINSKISQELKTLAEEIKPIAKKLASSTYKEKIQRETASILKNNRPAKEMLTHANTKLANVVLSLQKEVDDITNNLTIEANNDQPSNSYTAEEVAASLQTSNINLRKEYDDRQKVLEKLSKKVISMPRAKEMALDIFTNHAFKTLRERRRNLIKERPRIDSAIKELEILKAEFKNIAKPKWYQNKTKKDFYLTKKSELNKMESLINHREERLSSQLKDLDTEFAKLKVQCAEPTAITKINKITLGILQKNKPISDKYHQLAEQQTVTKNMLSETASLQQGVKQQIAYDLKNGQTKYTVKSHAPISCRGANSPITIAKAMNGNSQMAGLVAYSRKDAAEQKFEDSAKNQIDRKAELDITE